MIWWALKALAAPEMIPEEAFQEVQRPPDAAAMADQALNLRDGRTVRLADHRGQPVVLSFWASWCGPCRQELPDLAAWSKAHPEVVVLTVSVDRSQQAAEQFLRAVPFDLPVAFDPEGQRLGQLRVDAMPAMFLLDPRGALAWSHVGYSRAKGFTALEAALEAL
jgi:thiol-disulfide isomerase/thioredoxin